MIRIDCQSQNEVDILAHILEEHPLIDYEIWLIHPILDDPTLPIPQTRTWLEEVSSRKNGKTETGTRDLYRTETDSA